MRSAILLCAAVAVCGCGGGNSLTPGLPADGKTVTIRYFNGTSSSTVFQTNLPTTHTFAVLPAGEQDESVAVSFTIGSSENLTVSSGASASTFTATNTFSFNDANIQAISTLDVNLTSGGIQFFAH